MLKKPVTPIYFDYAAATPVDTAVTAAMLPYLSNNFYNPSAIYLAARTVKADILGARERIAKLLEVRASELIFTAGSTEANNLAISGVMQQFANANMAISLVEHYSVIKKAVSFNTVIMPVNNGGVLNIEAAVKSINSNTVLVSCMLVNNELGTIQPIAELAKKIATIKQDRLTKGNELPLYLHCDASQAFNYLQVLPHALGVDLLVIGGSKIYGPKQTATLFIKTGVVLYPQIIGGGQEYGLRAGTENVAGIMGLVKAFEISAKKRKKEHDRILVLQKDLISQLQKNIPEVQINGSLKKRIPNNVHITLTGTDNETLVMQLDEQGLQVAAGSACSASSDQPSHVLKALGLSDKAAQSSIRISMGRQTTKAHIDYLVYTLSHLLHS